MYLMNNKRMKQFIFATKQLFRQPFSEDHTAMMK